MLLVLFASVAAFSVVIISAVTGATPLRRRHAADNDEACGYGIVVLVVSCLSVMLLLGTRAAASRTSAGPPWPSIRQLRKVILRINIRLLTRAYDCTGLAYETVAWVDLA